MARPHDSTSNTSPDKMDLNPLLKSQRKLESKDLPSVRRLGKGFSGFIYETRWNGNKCARKDFPLGSGKHVIFEKEISVLLDLDHPNIVKCINYFIGRSSCSLLQEYMDDDLQSTMQRRIEAHRKKISTSNSHSRVLAADDMKRLLVNKMKEREIHKVDEGSARLLGSGDTIPFEVPEAEVIISQIATGMKYLHDNQVVHGDLKPKNVLVCSGPGEPCGMKVKVADFGLIDTKKMVKLISKRSQHFEILTWKAPELLEELLGPLTEDADDPFTDSDTDELERHNDGNFSFLAMADVYSFGLTCAHILGGKILFPNLSLTQLRKQRVKGFNVELPSACPKYLKYIIDLCLQEEPSRRPSFSAICTMKALLPHIPELLDSLIEGKQEDFMAFTDLTLTISPTFNSPREIIFNLPREIGNLGCLKTLQFSWCLSLESLPNEFGNLSCLETLDLSGCSSLGSLPNEIGNLSCLKSLDLRGCNRLGSLPNEFGNLSCLETLDLSGCSSLGSLPNEIGNLSALETLNLSECRSLESLPNEFGNLSCLETLDLSGCSSLGSLPNEIGNLSCLKSLDLRGCSRLGSLPNEIGNLSALETLNLSECRSLESLPKEFGNLSALETLNLSECRSLESLPNEIGNLSCLKSLDLRRCFRLGSLPNEIGNLSYLETLNLRGCNRLGSLPNEIGNLSALETLNLSECRSLESLPNEIGNLSCLETLDLSGCLSLGPLPNEIGNLSALETLDLSWCLRLGSLPNEIGNLSCLKTLNLREYSSLDSLPKEIGNLSCLKTLYLYGSRSPRELLGANFELFHLVPGTGSEFSRLPEHGRKNDLMSAGKKLPGTSQVKSLDSSKESYAKSGTEWTELSSKLESWSSASAVATEDSSLRPPMSSTLPSASSADSKKYDKLGRRI
ncbi:hypothetical protein M758_8G029500 [Ceratodon purpureus]|nr:hypothetical protein M758_8G029500 [Ceratodon purpureus]